jgi:hypothetical protein
LEENMGKIFFMLIIFFFLIGYESFGTPAEAVIGSGSPVPLHSLIRVLVGTSDRMTTLSSTEAQNFPVEGQIFYLPLTQLTGTIPIYRLSNGADHMDSLYPNEGGYSSEGILGYVWTNPSSKPGVSSFMRAFNANSLDHMSHHQFESLPIGYADEGASGYGFRRYNNSDQTLVLFSGGGITAHANLVAGAAVWDWSWNNMQFLNAVDCGRQLQTAVQSEALHLDAPECGDNFFYNSTVNPVPSWKKHGAPVVSYSVAGLVFQSSAIPLDFGWLWSNYWGTSQDELNLWSNWRVGKTITLNFNNMGPVAKYQASITSPLSVTDSRVEFPGIHLRANFNRFWTYDAGSKILTEVTSSMPNGCSNPNPKTFGPAYGGVIISDSTGNYAMGIYAGNISVGGNAHYLGMMKFVCNNDGIGQYSNDTVKLYANYDGNLGTTYTSYVINGTVQNVANLMLQLKNAGFK